MALGQSPPAGFPLPTSYFPLRCSLVLACVVAGCDELPEPLEKPPSSPAAQTQPVETPSPPESLVDRTFDDIKFDIEPDAPFDRSMLTDEIRELDGRRIRIRGYILPTEQKRGIREFVLVRDNQECCFGPGAALYDCILVKMEEGESTEFTIRPVAVEGAFRVEEFYYDEDAPPLAVFRLAGEAVE